MHCLKEARWSAVLFRLALLAGALLAFDFSLEAAGLRKFTDCQWIENPANDGDSFLVQAGDQQVHLRLYFVDCPESTATNDADFKRVREQARHFGLTEVAKVLEFGRDAKAFTEKALAKPFTVHTSFADAMGRSPGGRVYAFVITSDGKDLASLLLENGFARAHGVRRETPDGTSGDEAQKRLADIELQAVLKKVGIWSATDPDEIARLRALQREEDREVSDLRKQLSAKKPKKHSIDLNAATSRELQMISGVGPVLATTIISNRPYSSVEDLQRVKGVGPKLFERIRPYVMVRAQADTKPEK